MSQPTPVTPTIVSTSPALHQQVAQWRQTKTVRLGQILVASGLISRQVLEAALAAQSAGNEARIGDILVAMRAAEHAQIEAVVQRHIPPTSVDALRYPINLKALNCLTPKTALSLSALAMDIVDGVLCIAVARPLSQKALRRIEEDSGFVEVMALQAADVDDLEVLIKRSYVSVDSVRVANNGITPDAYDAATSDGGSPAGQLRRILSIALANDASDIHLRPTKAGGRQALMRVDGSLSELMTLTDQNGVALVRHLEAVSGSSLRKPHEPREGRLSLSVDGAQVDVRVSLIPGTGGDSLVLRILDPRNFPRSISALGLLPEQTATLERLVARPHGLFLVAGPTGTGKTTTLYTLIQQLARDKRLHVATAEDPVELQLENVNQFNTMDFTDTLKRLLRHDPDVLMIGELRDKDSAEAAIAAALTGHLVLSTVHATDAVSAIHRLIGLGMQPSALASCLTGVISQRLVRKLCKACEGKGCPLCRETGYLGRHLVAEVIRPRRELIDALTPQSPYSQIRAATEFVSEQDLDARILSLVQSGETDIGEAEKIVVHDIKR